MSQEPSIIHNKCRHLKNADKIHSTWFWNNSVNVKLDEISQPRKIHHVIDIEKLLGEVRGQNNDRSMDMTDQNLPFLHPELSVIKEMTSHFFLD